MANDLTGDFDVVAEFSVPAANRVLAAMHRGGRLPHSWSLRVDDYAHPHVPLTAGSATTGIRSVVDAFGEPVIDPGMVAKVSGNRPSGSASGPINPNWDPPVNVAKTPAENQGQVAGHSDPGIAGHPGIAGTLSPAARQRATHLIGVAQLQLGAPTITLLEHSDTSIAVHTPVMARYTHDPGTLEIPDLLQGEFRTTIDVEQASSPAGMFINVNLAGKGGNASFSPKWVSPGWNSEAEQLNAINKALLNSLRTSFEPSSTQVSSGVLIMKFKPMSGPPPVVAAVERAVGSNRYTGPVLAVMMAMPGGVLASESPVEYLRDIVTGAPYPSSVANVFLDNGDDFALSASSQFAQLMFKKYSDGLKQWPFSFWYTLEIKIPNPFSKLGLGPDNVEIKVITVTFTTIIDSVKIEFQDVYPNGRILVTVEGSANTTTEGIPKFSFTATQALTLELVDSASDGSTADLIALGEPSLEASAPGIPDFVIDKYFKPTATANFKTQVTNFLKQINPGLQKRLSAQNNLGEFLGRLMNPIPTTGAEPVEKIDPQLTYTSYEISSSGILLHGTLQVPAWPRAHVDFGFRDVPGVGPLPLLRGEYNALKSWIPGGTIQEYIWNQEGGPPLHDDHHTFLFEEKRAAGPLVHLCLTAKGSRISAGGPITYEAVTASSLCAWHSHINARLNGLGRRSADWPKIALVQKAVSGGVEVVGHTSPWASAGALPENATNLIVHFPDHQSLATLDQLTHALQKGGLSNTATGIVVVLSPDQLAAVRSFEGIVCADDDKVWAHLLGLDSRPETFIIAATGEVVWRHHGQLRTEELAHALEKLLPAGGRFTPRLLRASVRIGQLAPNFLFQTAPGSELTLRKLTGRFVILLFWNSSSQASIETLRDLHLAFVNAGSQGPVVLAINDGDSAELAHKAAAENGISALVVADPSRDISLAYGVNVWPTAIFLDDTGLVVDTRYGRFSKELGRAPAGQAAD